MAEWLYSSIKRAFYNGGEKTVDLITKNDDCINILLLGETGVGKSTFINSIVNYLTYNDIEDAEKKAPIALIPSKYTVQDEHGDYHTICIGSDDDRNECLDTGMSATQDVKSYVFPIWDKKTKIRLIDTPGIGDVRGIEQDNKNWMNILTYIEQFQQLHAICYLLKPTQSRRTIYFDYCITEILSRLDKSASNNLIFVFTNTRGVHYTPGDTLSVLQKVLGDIKSKSSNVHIIPLNKNVFCCDNEAFRYLAAITKNVVFDNFVIKRNYESWKWSVQQCKNLINYIVGNDTDRPLEPHFIKNTIIVNEIRRLVLLLAKAVAEISQTLADNTISLERYKKNLDLETDLLQELQKQLYMPIIDVEVTKLPHSALVCASAKCAEVYKVGDINKWHYKQICQNPCYISTIPKEIIGCPEIAKCSVINSLSKACKICCCDFSVHMYVGYITKPIEGKKIDYSVKISIDSKEKLLQNIRKLIQDTSKKNDELTEERNTIVKACTNFAHLLQDNVITSFSDTGTEYIEYLIMNERSRGMSSNQSVIHDLQKLLKEYGILKQSFNDVLSTQKNVDTIDPLVTPQKIENTIMKLYQLKHNGMKIKKLYEVQKKSCTKTNLNAEYVHEMLPHVEADANGCEEKRPQHNINKNAGQQEKWFYNSNGSRYRQQRRSKSQTRYRIDRSQTPDNEWDKPQYDDRDSGHPETQPKVKDHSEIKMDESQSQQRRKYYHYRGRGRGKSTQQSQNKERNDFDLRNDETEKSPSWNKDIYQSKGRFEETGLFEIQDSKERKPENRYRQYTRRSKSQTGYGTDRSQTPESELNKPLYEDRDNGHSETQPKVKDHSEIRENESHTQHRGKYYRGRGRGNSPRQFNAKNHSQYHHYPSYPSDFYRHLQDAYMAGYLAGQNSHNYLSHSQDGTGPPPKSYYQFSDSKISDGTYYNIREVPQSYHMQFRPPYYSYYEGFHQYISKSYGIGYVQHPPKQEQNKREDVANQSGNSNYKV